MFSLVVFAICAESYQNTNSATDQYAFEQVMGEGSLEMRSVLMVEDGVDVVEVFFDVLHNTTISYNLNLLLIS